MKYDILSRFSAPLSRSKYNKSGVEGFQRNELLVTVRCDLDSFIQMTQSLQEDVNLRAHTTFKPDLPSFHSPSRATSTLSVDFDSAFTLLNWMGVKDYNDHHTFALKETKGNINSNVPRILRIVGTSCVLTLTKRHGSELPVDVDCVLPFASCTRSQVDQIRHLLSTTPITPTSDPETCNSGLAKRCLRFDVVLYRYRENYDGSQGRYISPWRARRVTWSSFHSGSELGQSTSSYYNSTSTIDADSTFSVEWSRRSSLPSSQWTEDATFFGAHVMGQITTFLPVITFYGPSTLAEISGLIESFCM